MSRIVRLRTPIALLGALVLGACAQTPARTDARAAEPNLEFVRTPQWANGLRWETPLATASAASATIGPAGGRLALPATGLVLTVPAGAVAAPTRFAVTALPGTLVAYDFQPHGVAFAKPVILEQSLRGTARVERTASVEGGSFTDASQLDQVAGTAQVAEYRPSERARGGDAVRIAVPHFSGWVFTTGRR